MKISFQKSKNINTSPIKELALVLFLCLVGLAMHVGVQSQVSESVTATVTAQQIALSVSDGAVAYGTLDIGSTMTTLTDGVNDTQTVTNDGNVNQDFSIQGQDSSPDNWTLAATAGSDTYAHEFSTDSGVGWTAMESATYTTFATGVGASASESLDLNIHMPTSTTATAEQNVDVSVQAESSGS